MAEATFDTLCDQLSSMLGADSLADLPTVDQARIGIYVNQAYRECYAPIDGRRPRWASKKMSALFLEGIDFVELASEVIDVQKQPELVGEGPLSPLSSDNDTLKIRSSWSGDFFPRNVQRNFIYSVGSKDPEIGKPIWYYIDQSDDGDDLEVIPKMYLYPVPDKDYTVNFTANVLPNDLESGDKPRLPANIGWDILLPMAQYKLLADPRYNGDNRELILMQAKEARRKLRSFSSVQKHKQTRIVIRRGW